MLMRFTDFLKILTILSFLILIFILPFSGCDQIRSMTGSKNKIVGIWDKDGGASFVRHYYHFKPDGNVVFGIWRNDGTRTTEREGKYKLEENKVLIQWKFKGSTQRMSREELRELEKWHHVLNYNPDTDSLRSLAGEVFKTVR